MGESQSKERTLEVAVIGRSGCGKSTFINTYCPLSKDNSAPTGVVETTTDVTPYLRIRTHRWPISEEEEATVKASGIKYFVRVWDFPGFDNREIDCQNNLKYLKMIKQKKFDFYILASRDRVLDFERDIHNVIVDQGKRYFYLRTHFDRDVANTQRDFPGTDESEIKENLKREIQKKLSSEPEIFFINAKQRNQYDFAKLERQLVGYVHISKGSKERFTPVERSTSSCSLQ